MRLVARCANVEWVREENVYIENPAARILGMSLGHHGQSNVSVVEIAQQSEKPGVYTPSRGGGMGDEGGGGMEIVGEA